ncbi:MAG: peptidase S41, partial [Acidobacteriota bacterium]
MMNRSLLACIFTAIAVLLAPFAWAANDAAGNTKMLSGPTVSGTRIAFGYDGDIWVAGIDGSEVRRLTTAPGDETNPSFSPDGALVAFTGNYDGNQDVYVVPAQGGVPKRLTWHPGSDASLGFTPDGSQVLFRSARQVFTNRHSQLFTVSVQGGFPERLDIPNAHKASYSPDGARMAYTPLSERFRQWKNYRGGTTSRIWLYNFRDHAVVQIPQPEGRCNDTDPMWPDRKTVYFLSDRNGEFNLFSYHAQSKRVSQLTTHEDFPILSASAGDGKIIYEQAGLLHLFDPKKGKAKQLQVTVASEVRETRPRYLSGAKYIRHAGISPSGVRAVFEFRGEIITFPAEKGDPRNLTETPGTHERSPAWSPDGAKVAYFSDQSGEYQLHVKSQDGRGEPKAYPLQGAGFYSLLSWSPDSKKVAYMDNSLTLYWLDLESGAAKKIGANQLYGPGNSQNIDYSWSPGSHWIAYTLNSHSLMRTAHLYSLQEDRSWPVTDGLSDVTQPVFDASGKYLYFLGSTDAGPVRQWFAMSNADMNSTQSIYLAVLRSDLPNPLARESDEEKAPDDDGEEKPESESESAAEEESGASGEDEGEGEGEGEGEEEEEAKEEALQIDFENFGHRILALPLPARSYSNLIPGKAGELYFMESPQGGGRSGGPPNADLKRFSLEKREAETLASDVRGFTLSSNLKKMLLFTKGDNCSIVAAGKVKPGKCRL